MSWNISTRLNNLQNQVNNIANHGLTNPLEQILDANSYALQNLNILDGGANILKLQSSNVGGITTNNTLTVGGDAFVNTLHYTALSPPISGGNSYKLCGNVTEPTAGNFIFNQGNPNIGFVSYNTNSFPYATASMTTSSANNNLTFGFSTSNTLYPDPQGNYINYGVLWYPLESLLQVITNGVLGATYYITNELIADLTLKAINGRLLVFYNGNEIETLEQAIPNGEYYLACFGYANSDSNITVNGVKFGSLENIEGLADVLQVNNNANGYSMQNVGEIYTRGINCIGDVFTSGFLEIGNEKNNTSQLHLLYGDGTINGDNYQIVGATGAIFSIQQYTGTNLTNTPLQINSNSVLFKTNNLGLTNDGTNNYSIIDSGLNPPMYKQIFSNMNGGGNNFHVPPRPLITIPIYTKTPTYNYGVNYSEMLFSSLNLTFTCATPFSGGLTATLFLGGSDSSAYDATKGNCLTIPITEGETTSTFNSSIPIIFYYNNTTQFNTAYLLLGFSNIGLSTYNCAISNSNMVVSGCITSNPNGTIIYGS